MNLSTVALQTIAVVDEQLIKFKSIYRCAGIE